MSTRAARTPLLLPSLLFFSIVTLGASTALAGDLDDPIFADDFEAGNTSAWICVSTGGGCPDATAPQAMVPDPVEVDQGSTVQIDLTGTDVDDDPLTFSVETLPGIGSVDPTSGATPPGTVTYTAPACDSGDGSFTFLVNDGTFDSDEVTATVTVNPVDTQPPVAEGQTGEDAIETDEDTDVPVTLGASDDCTGDLTYEIVSNVPVSAGVLTGTAPDLTFEPAENFNGSTSFTFKVIDEDLQESNTATVEIDVTAINDVPTATDLGPLPVDPGGNIGINLLGNDVDLDSLTFEITALPGQGLVTPTTGSVPTGAVTYTASACVSGADAFTYVVNDGEVDSPSATVSITINDTSDPPTAESQTGEGGVETDEDTNTSITLVSADDCSETLTFDIDDATLDGTLTGTAPNLTFEPDEDFNGSTSFSFTVTDDQDQESESATVEITVNAVNDMPLAQDDPGNDGLPAPLVTVGNSLLASGGSVLDNDSDVEDGEGTNLSIVDFDAASSNGGSVDLDIDPQSEAYGSFSFQPAAGDTSVDSFTYTVRDAGDGESAALEASATVTIDIEGMVWYVDNTNALPGDGRSETPFKNLASAAAVAADGDTIFVFAGTGTTANQGSGITLTDGVDLIGEGAGLAIEPNVSIPAGTPPKISNGGGAAVTLANGNTVAGLELSSPSGAGLSGGSVAGLTVDEVRVSSPGTDGVLISAGSGLLSFSDFSVTGASGHALDITGTGSEGDTVLLDTDGGNRDLASSGGGVVIADVDSVQIPASIPEDSREPIGNLNVTAEGGPALSLTNVTTAAATFGTLVSNNSSSSGVEIDNVGGTVTVATSTTVTASTGAGVRIANSDLVANLTATSVTNGAGQGGGAELTSNSGKLGFAGIDLSTDGSTGLSATSTGTVNVTGDGNIITAATARAVDVTDASLTAIFESISAADTDLGINLTNAGQGGFNVTGTGANASGGTIQNITARGIQVIETDNVSFFDMDLLNTSTENGAIPILPASTCGNITLDSTGSNEDCNAAVYLRDVDGADFDNLLVDGSAQEGINGLRVANLSIIDSQITNAGNQQRENALRIRELTGVSSISNTDLSNSFASNAEIRTYEGLLDLSISNSTFGTNGVGGLVVGVATPEAVNRGGGVHRLAIDGSTFDSTSFGAINAIAGFDSPAAGGTLDLSITDSNVANSTDGILITALRDAALFADISNNGTVETPLSIRNGGGDIISIVQSDNAIIDANISGNFLDGQGSIGGSPVVFDFQGPGSGGSAGVIRVDNNVFANIGESSAVFVDVGNGSTNVETTISNNDVEILGGSGGSGLETRTSGASTMCLAISGNVVDAATNGRSVRVRAQGGSTTSIEQGVSASTNPATVIVGNNPGLVGTVNISTFISTIDVTTGTCLTPVSGSN